MVVIIMGVSGSGKSTVGAMLARRFGARFIEGDDYHPSANIEKMSSGAPLDDSDRMPWLAALACEIRRHRAGGADVVVACSALKASYRELLAGDIPDSFFVYLKGDEPLIRQRIDKRPGHFMLENCWRASSRYWKNRRTRSSPISRIPWSGSWTRFTANCGIRPGGSAETSLIEPGAADTS